MIAAEDALFFRGGKVLDEQALSYLFDNHFPLLTGYAKGIIGDYEASRDLVTEAFILLWDRRHRFDNLGAAKSYLLKCTHHKCLNYLRREKLRQAYIDQIRKEALAQIDADNIARKETESNEFYALLLAVEQLPDKCKEVMKLALSGMDTREIATRMNISIKTVQNTRWRAVKRLRKQLGKSDLPLAMLVVLLRFLKKFI